MKKGIVCEYNRDKELKTAQLADVLGCHATICFNT